MLPKRGGRHCPPILKLAGAGIRARHVASLNSIVCKRRTSDVLLVGTHSLVQDLPAPTIVRFSTKVGPLHNADSLVPPCAIYAHDTHPFVSAKDYSNPQSRHALFFKVDKDMLGAEPQPSAASPILPVHVRTLWRPLWPPTLPAVPHLPDSRTLCNADFEKGSSTSDWMVRYWNRFKDRLFIDEGVLLGTYLIDGGARRGGGRVGPEKICVNHSLAFQCRRRVGSWPGGDPPLKRRSGGLATAVSSRGGGSAKGTAWGEGRKNRVKEEGGSRQGIWCSEQ